MFFIAILFFKHYPFNYTIVIYAAIISSSKEKEMVYLVCHQSSFRQQSQGVEQLR